MGIFDSLIESINASTGNVSGDGTNAFMRMGAALQGKEIPMGNSGAAFEGNAFDAQVANELYQQGLQQGLDPQTAKRRAIDKVFASRLMTIAGPEGQVITGPTRAPIFGESPLPNLTASDDDEAPETTNLPGGFTTITPPKELTAEQKFAKKQSLADLEKGEKALQNLISIIEQDPSKAGVVGTGRNIAATGINVLGDLARGAGLPKAESMARQAAPDSLSTSSPLISDAIYGIARVRKGDDNKLNKDDIESAREDFGLTGLTKSSPQALAKLKKSLEQIQNTKASYSGIMDEFNVSPPKKKQPNPLPGNYDELLRNYDPNEPAPGAPNKIYKFNPKTGKLE